MGCSCALVTTEKLRCGGDEESGKEESIESDRGVAVIGVKEDVSDKWFLGTDEE